MLALRCALAAMLATLPLTAQGSTGPLTQITSQAELDEPDVAFDDSLGVYLVVWENNNQIQAQRVSATGAPFGSVIALGTGTRPRVATVQTRSAFFVVWNASGGVVRARAVFSGTGARSSTVEVTRLMTLADYDIIGEVVSDDDAVVVWRERFQIRGAQLQIDSQGAVSVFGSTKIADLAATSGNGLVAANTGGPFRRALVCWAEFTGSIGFIQGAVINMNLTLLDDRVSAVPLSTQAVLPTGLDGDGSVWMLAYTRPEPTGSFRDLYCRSLSFIEATSNTGVGAEVAMGTLPSVSEDRASLAWVGESSVMSFARISGSIALRSTAVDPFNCRVCGPVRSPGLTGTGDSAVAGAPFAASSGNDGLLVWVESVPGNDRLWAQTFMAEDGVVADLGGGCGQGGRVQAPCARAGNATFHLRLIGAERQRNTLLIASPRRMRAVCGPCVLVPDLGQCVVVGPLTTDTSGDAELSVPLPGGVGGQSLYVQWFVDTATSTCPSVGGSFSNAAQVVLQ